ncbi:MAG: PHB depolymerase family esterase [Burkholderiales bacterium]|nr:PHB depolymerase family esterase [Burkholderiales bacterium]
MHLKQKSWNARLLHGAFVSLASLVFAAPAAWAGWNSTAESIENHPTWLYTPASTMPSGKRALLIVMHGCDQTHTQLKEWGNLGTTAEQRGVVMAVPWVARPWPVFSSTNCWNYDGATDGSKNIAEMEALAKTLIDRSDLNIDRRHVYVAGLSSGASVALDLACKAPDLIAGVGAVAGPSVGSSQMDAIKDGGQISYTAEAARDKCKALAGKSKLPYFDLQIANIAYGEKDKNAESPGCSYSAGATNCPGTFQLVSKKWSTINAEMFRQIYLSSTLGTPALVAGGGGKESVSAKNGKTSLALTSVLGVGHAWPAGSGADNDVNKGGIWMAQKGMNYSQYVIDWFFANNRRGITCDARSSADMKLSVGGDAGANGAAIVGWKVAIDGPTSIPEEPVAGSVPSFSKAYGPLTAGTYSAKVTATDNVGKEWTCSSSAQVGQVAVPLLDPPAVNKQSVTSTSIILTWQSVKDARSYLVTRTGGSAATPPESVAQSTSGTVTYTASGLSPSTTYTFSVQSVNAENKAGKGSDPLPVTTNPSTGGFTCTDYTASNKAHIEAKRAYDYFYQAFAKGSNLYLGWNNSYVVTTLAETKPGYFVYGKCPK